MQLISKLFSFVNHLPQNITVQIRHDKEIKSSWVLDKLKYKVGKNSLKNYLIVCLNNALVYMYPSSHE